MKKAAIAVASLLALTFAGCGQEVKAPAADPTTDSTTKPTETDAPPPAEAAVNLRFANVTTDSAKQAGDKFAELVAQYSGGEISVDVFQGNELGDDKVLVEGAQIGDIDIAVTSTSSVTASYADYYAFDTPFLFLSSDEVYDIGFDSEPGKAIRDGVESIGLKGLAMWENGFRNITNSKLPVRTPEDMKGLKIRTMENEIHLAAWKALGANPTPMAFSELFTAMQQGTVDGQENPIGIISSNKFYEVQKYISMSGHVYTPYAVLMNLDKYNSLTDSQREAVDKAMAEASDFQIEQSHTNDAASMKTITDFGSEIIELTADEKAQFQKIVEEADIYSLAKSKMEHPELFDQLVEALKATR